MRADGYIAVRVNGKQVKQHRLVMEEQLARPLERHERVHHRNGVRHDNRPENLELWIKGHPAGQRVEDIAAFMVEHYRDAVEAALRRRE